MRVKNRLSPYPILNDYGDDYGNASFAADIDVVVQFLEIYGKIKFSLEEPYIKQLVEERRAEFVAHVECPAACYREVFFSYEPEIDFKILAEEVTEKLEVRTFIILKEDVADFCSPNFHPDYKGYSFPLKKDQIIAIGSAVDYTIQKDDRDMESLPSIFQITKLKDKKKGSLSVNTDSGEHIVIGLAEDVFELYAKLGKNLFKSTAFSIVLFPAMVVVLQRMYEQKDESSYTSMHWYEVIESLLEKNGFSVEDLNIQSDELLSICQSLFADPIARSLKELENHSERM